MPKKKGSPRVCIREMTCKRCGKNFVPAVEHKFKVDTKYYCSWTCYNHRNDKEAVKDDQGST